MSRGKWRWNDETKSLEDYEEIKVEVNAPYVITDEIPGGLKSMADRRIYNSKKRLRESYRRHGFVEVGNEDISKPIERKHPKDDPAYQKQLEDDIGYAQEAVRYGMAPLTEYDKHRCEIINKQISESYDTRERDDFGNPKQ